MIDSLKKIIKFLLTILIVILMIRFFIYILPFILIFLLGYLVYKKVKGNNVNDKNDHKIRKNIINKKTTIIEGEIVKERIDN